MQLPLLKSPETKMLNLLKKIEKGRGDEDTAEDFLKLLSKNQDHLEEVIPALTECLKKQDSQAGPY